MRTKSLVLIIIALGCGLVASIGISEVLKQKPEGPAETESILVAALDIDIGKKLDAENVKIEEWPMGKVPEGAIHTLEEVKDQYTRSRMYAGEPVLSAKLMDHKNESAPIPEGYRVLPVKIDIDTVIGVIQPGDLVDVMVFLRQGPDIPRTGTYTILRMARVYAVNTQTDRATDDQKGQEAAAKTVSLLVKPKQAERLTLATEMGKIRLALRRPTDEIPDDELVEKDLPAIFRAADVVAMDKPAPKVETPVVAPPVPTNVVPLVEMPALAAAPVWTMRIMSPTEIKQFDWAKDDDLPQENAATSLTTPKAEPSPEPEPAAAGVESDPTE
jgi:pilus assembly protein CpaB